MQHLAEALRAAAKPIGGWSGVTNGMDAPTRDGTKMDRLKRAMHRPFDWLTPPGCPADLPLRMLEAGDAQRLATQLSCTSVGA